MRGGQVRQAATRKSIETGRGVVCLRCGAYYSPPIFLHSILASFFQHSLIIPTMALIKFSTFSSSPSRRIPSFPWYISRLQHKERVYYSRASGFLVDEAFPEEAQRLLLDLDNDNRTTSTHYLRLHPFPFRSETHPYKSFYDRKLTPRGRNTGTFSVLVAKPRLDT